MISRGTSVNRYCSDPIENIDRYQEAISSKELYVIHHKKEDDGYSKKELIEMGLYYYRPSSELVFMEMSEHRRHHTIGDKNPYKGSMRGTRHPNYGKHLSEETKRRISESNIGKKAGDKNPFFGKTHSREFRERISGKGNPSYKLVCPLILYSMYCVKGMSKKAIGRELGIRSKLVSKKLTEYNLQ